MRDGGTAGIGVARLKRLWVVMFEAPARAREVEVLERVEAEVATAEPFEKGPSCGRVLDSAARIIEVPRPQQVIEVVEYEQRDATRRVLPIA